MNGVEFARQVRVGKTAVQPMVPIILITGHADEKVVRAAKETGIDAVVTKPVSAQLLSKRIHAAWAARGGASA